MMFAFVGAPRRGTNTYTHTQMVVTLHVVKYWNAHVDQKEFWARNNDVVGGGKLKRGACVLWGGIFNQVSRMGISCYELKIW